MLCFRHFTLITALPASLLEASWTWTGTQRLIYGFLEGELVMQVVKRLAGREPIEGPCDAQFARAFMSAYVLVRDHEIRVVITAIDFDGGRPDPDGGIGLDALAFEKKFLSTRSMIYARGEVWTFEQIEGFPIFIPILSDGSISDKVGFASLERTTTIINASLENMARRSGPIGIMAPTSGLLLEMARNELSLTQRLLSNPCLLFTSLNPEKRSDGGHCEYDRALWGEGMGEVIDEDRDIQHLLALNTMSGIGKLHSKLPWPAFYEVP